MKKIAFLVGGILWVASKALASTPAPEPIIVGVQEDRPGIFAGEKHKFQVRVLFQKTDADWKPFPSNTLSATEYPAEVSWTLALNGKKLAEEKTRRPTKFEFYSDVGQQLVADQDQAQKLVSQVSKQRSSEFAGFTGERVYRPIPAISRPFFQDPEGWKPGTPSASLLEKAREDFKAYFTKELNCPKNCKDIEAKILVNGKAYKNKAGNWVVPMQYKEKSEKSEGWAVSGTYVSTLNQPSYYIPGELRLVDAADFDQDGKTELLFALTGYNVGGYVLTYNNSQKLAKFQFTYH